MAPASAHRFGLGLASVSALPIGRASSLSRSGARILLRPAGVVKRRKQSSSRREPRMRKLLLLVPVMAAFMALGIACGDSDNGPAATPAPTTASIQEITIKGIEQGEQYLFDPKQINARPGTIRL